MSWESNCECDDCGDSIDNNESTYCESCFESHNAECRCEKCKRPVEDAHESVIYCEECWEKHCKPINEQLADLMDTLAESMAELPGNFNKVRDQYLAGEKNMDAVYQKMAKVQEGFKELQTALLTKPEEPIIATAEIKTE